MTVGGWIFLVVSWGAILLVAAYCMAKVLKGKR